MAYTRIYIHLVIGTKRRYPFLYYPVRHKLIAHIREKAKEKNIHIHSINGADDHLHMLIRLEPAQDIASIAQQIKGESANWINKELLTEKKFMWATGYYAGSIDGEDQVRIAGYVNSQDIRHSSPIQYFLRSAEEGKPE
ncbi:MAG: IS200/IS605 family transposase [Bacteroidota bacterium]